MLILILLNYFIEKLDINYSGHYIEIINKNTCKKDMKSFLGYNKNFINYNKLEEKKYLLYNQNKLFTGIAYSCFKNGTKKVEITYVNGEPVGEFITWHENGLIKEEGFYRGISIIKRKKENTEGMLYLKDLNNKDGKYYYQGKLFTGNVISGKTNSVIYTRYIFLGFLQGGGLILLKPRIDKVLEGKHTSYYSNGKKESEEYYINGKLDGKQKYWYENGNYYGYEKYKNGNLILSVFVMWKLRPYEKKLVLNEFLHNNNERIQKTTYFTDYDNFLKNDIYKTGKLVEFWSKKDGISYLYKKREKKKLLDHYKNFYGIPYVEKGMYWCYKRYDEYLDDFVKIFKEKAKNNVSYLDIKAIPVESYEVNYVIKKIFPLGELYRTFSCENDKCKIIYYMLSDIKKANKYWELDLKLEGGYFFPIIYIFEREIDLKEKDNDKLKYMLSC